MNDPKCNAQWHPFDSMEDAMTDHTTQPATERLAAMYDRDYPNGECVPGDGGRCIRVTHDHDRAVS